MSAYVKRTVNGREEWLGKDRHGRWQWTSDKPSRKSFESKTHAKLAVDALVAQVIGRTEVTTE